MKLLMIILLVQVGIIAHTQSASLTVISNLKGAPSEMKQSALKSVFRGEKQKWSDGNKIIIALMKTNTAVGKSVCEKVYNMSGDELRKYWLALVFQGKADAPLFFNTVSEMETYVSENPGAIGIIDRIPSAPGIQVVLIDGKKSF